MTIFEFREVFPSKRLLKRYAGKNNIFYVELNEKGNVCDSSDYIINVITRL